LGAERSDVGARRPPPRARGVRGVGATGIAGLGRPGLHGGRPRAGGASDAGRRSAVVHDGGHHRVCDRRRPGRADRRTALGRGPASVRPHPDSRGPPRERAGARASRPARRGGRLGVARPRGLPARRPGGGRRARDRDRRDLSRGCAVGARDAASDLVADGGRTNLGATRDGARPAGVRRPGRIRPRPRREPLQGELRVGEAPGPRPAAARPVALRAGVAPGRRARHDTQYDPGRRQLLRGVVDPRVARVRPELRGPFAPTRSPLRHRRTIRVRLRGGAARVPARGAGRRARLRRQRARAVAAAGAPRSAPELRGVRGVDPGGGRRPRRRRPRGHRRPRTRVAHRGGRCRRVAPSLRRHRRASARVGPR